jgi:predicted metalloprotease with PDZ domain
MSNTTLRRALLISIIGASAARAQATPRPLSYVIRLPDPANKTFEVDVAVPSEGRDSLILMMPIWSPGMYTLQSYGDRVTAISAKAAEGSVLDVTKPAPSRWVVKTGRAETVTVSYTLSAPRGTNLSSGVTDTSLVIIGPATFMTLAEPSGRAADVRSTFPRIGSRPRHPWIQRRTGDQTTSSRRTTTSSSIRRFSPERI